MQYQKEDILISLRNVGVRFNQNRSVFRRSYFDALKDVSFDIRAGQSIGIIGKNGAGKSTLLSLIAGVIAPDWGQVINYGVSVSLLALHAGFSNELSGRCNIMLSGLAMGFCKAEILREMETIIEYSGIREHIDVPVRTYSSGMRARLGFSIAHMLRPDILLVDETLGVGDKDFQVKSSASMREKIKSDQTVVLVSHNAKTVNELCSRAIWIENGTLIAEGPVSDIVNQYERT